MRTSLVPFAMGIALLFNSCSSKSPTGSAGVPGAAFDASWARDAVWDDGQAEVALYEARRPQYGKIESYEAVFIVVKEEFNASLFVKADPPRERKRLFPVMKLNALHSYWTENYPYHYLLSVFVRRDDPTRLVKLALGSQEWCGATFKEVRTWGSRPELVFHSYFDGQGDGSRPLDLGAGDLLEDQLPVALRSLKFKPGLRLESRVLPSLMANRMRKTSEFFPATFTVTGEEPVDTPLGTRAAWKLEARFADLEQTWWFEKAAPVTLLKMESSDGRAWLLKARTRKPYWKVATFRAAM